MPRQRSRSFTQSLKLATNALNQCYHQQPQRLKSLAAVVAIVGLALAYPQVTSMFWDCILGSLIGLLVGLLVGFHSSCIYYALEHKWKPVVQYLGHITKGELMHTVY